MEIEKNNKHYSWSRNQSDRRDCRKKSRQKKLHQITEALLNDKENPMDFLRDIVGMDWGEEGLGALYLLESTRTGARITLKAVTTDREKALLPTVSDLVENGSD